ncbi:putative transmembrane protein [Acidovorax delafieldii 2AN]|uniref:Putative transmembrane protein n=1 Tax=Acidovorax delafieldii 2AN TaxID=573060 RepID=C5T9I3_ACIDE|nr:YfiR family protein [Acidovorax delafieldii]EER58860.1 putative transmembrane protein [Acidovorax delafieldii 2AN]
MVCIRPLRTLLLVWLAVACLAPRAHAAEPVGEPDLKAAYVFNFIQFIDWSDAAQPAEGDWLICVSSFSPLKRPLTALEGRFARKGQAIRVRLLDVAELRHCRVVVLHSSDPEPLLRALRAMPPRSGILTISDQGADAPPDTMITLFQDGSRVAFGINTEATGKAGLTVSSRLLRLARGASK